MGKRRKGPSLRKRTDNVYRCQKRRAERSGQSLDYGLEELRTKVAEAMSQECGYCHTPFTVANWGCDHAKPVSRGGSYDLANVEIVCRTCNERKGALNGAEYASLLHLIGLWPEMAKADVLRRLRAGGRMRR